MRSHLQPTCFSRAHNELGYFDNTSSMPVLINWECPSTLKPIHIIIQVQEVQHRAINTVRKLGHMKERRNCRRWVYSAWRRFMENFFAVLLQRVTATYWEGVAPMELLLFLRGAEQYHKRQWHKLQHPIITLNTYQLLGPLHEHSHIYKKEPKRGEWSVHPRRSTNCSLKGP